MDRYGRGRLLWTRTDRLGIQPSRVRVFTSHGWHEGSRCCGVAGWTYWEALTESVDAHSQITEATNIGHVREDLIPSASPQSRLPLSGGPHRGYYDESPDRGGSRPRVVDDQKRSVFGSALSFANQGQACAGPPSVSQPWGLGDM